jgi:lipopolysaccharide export system permease protein
MKILDRYICRQVFTSTVIAVSVLSVVLVLGNIFKKLLDLLVSRDAPLELVLSLIAYILPFSLTFTIPWGFLTAVLLVFGKMSAENELVALRSIGVSVARVTATVFVLAIVCTGICLWINVDVAPKAQKRMQEAFFNIATSNPLSLFGSDKVIDEFPGRKIYVGKNEGKELYNLLMYQLNEGLDPTSVIYARRGDLEVDLKEKQVLMHLYETRMEQRDSDEPGDLLKIKQGIIMGETVAAIPLKELYEKNKKKGGIGQLTIQELFAATALDGSAVRMELSKRFSSALASLAFALFAVPLAITAQRKETSIGFMLSLMIAFVYFFLQILIDMVRNKPAWHPEILIWAPNLVFFAVGGWLFYRLSRR